MQIHKRMLFLLTWLCTICPKNERFYALDYMQKIRRKSMYNLAGSGSPHAQ